MEYGCLLPLFRRMSADASLLAAEFRARNSQRGPSMIECNRPRGPSFLMGLENSLLSPGVHSHSGYFTSRRLNSGFGHWSTGACHRTPSKTMPASGWSDGQAQRIHQEGIFGRLTGVFETPKPDG